MEFKSNIVRDEQLTKWLTYVDVDARLASFVGGGYIGTDAFTYRSAGDPSSSMWEQEEWALASVLVPVEQLEEAERVLTFHDLKIEPQWIDRNRFDFATSVQIKGIPVKPWSFVRKHPATGTHLVEIQRDFLIYHALDRRGTGDQYELVHPLDNLDVVRVRIEKHAFYNPTLRLEVHRDYLRDYLAAAEMGMVVGAVADRFRNSLVPHKMTPALSQAPSDVEVSVNEITEYKERYWRARAILHRTTAIKPYTAPRPERSPWYCYDLPPEASKLEFITDAEGRKRTLNTSPPYLYFRPGVLRKYLKNPYDSVFFHMRSWGTAQTAGAIEPIDVGINSAGLVNAFALDLEKQRSAEQQYWASFSCLPSDPVCEELFQTRMQHNPPKSPGTVELIQTEITRLNASFETRFGEPVHNDIPPHEKTMQRLSVGPLEENWDEVAELAKDLYSWVAEGLRIATLRKPLDAEAFDKDWKQFKLLETLMSRVLGCGQSDLTATMGPLKDLNSLRVTHAHNLIVDRFRHFDLKDRRVREAWFIVVDGIVRALRLLSDHLESNREVSGQTS